MAGFPRLIGAAYAALALALLRGACHGSRIRSSAGLPRSSCRSAIFQGALTVAGPLAEACAL
jgi:hypothetical protein